MLYTCGDGGLDGGEFDFDGDLLADEDAAGFEGHVPVEAEILAVDGGFDGQAGALHAVEVFELALIFGIEGDGLCDAVHCQVASYAVLVAAERLDVRAFEGDEWILFRVKEIGGAEMRVALFVAGVDAGDIGLGFDPGMFGMRLVDGKLAAYNVELSLDGADHHVPD